MLSQHLQKKTKIKFFFHGLILAMAMSIIYFSPQSIAAQGFFPFNPFGFAQPGNFQSAFPSHQYFNPFINSWGVPGNTASIQGNLQPFFSPRFINSEEVIPQFLGVTTIYLDPAVTLLDKVVIKPLDADPIKLSGIIPPLVVYIYPSGYVPLTIPLPPTSPITAFPPTAVIAPATTIVPTVLLPPATGIAPAVLSGYLWPFFNSRFF